MNVVDEDKVLYCFSTVGTAEAEELCKHQGINVDVHDTVPSTRMFKTLTPSTWILWMYAAPPEESTLRELVDEFHRESAVSPVDVNSFCLLGTVSAFQNMMKTQSTPQKRTTTTSRPSRCSLGLRRLIVVSVFVMMVLIALSVLRRTAKPPLRVL